MSGKEYSYSLEELKQILKSKNDKIELISLIKINILEMIELN